MNVDIDSLVLGTLGLKKQDVPELCEVQLDYNEELVCLLVQAGSVSVNWLTKEEREKLGALELTPHFVDSDYHDDEGHYMWLYFGWPEEYRSALRLLSEYEK